MFPTNFKLAKLIQTVSTNIIECRVKITNRLIAEITNLEQRQKYLSILVELSEYEQQIFNKIKTFEFDKDVDFDLIQHQIEFDLDSIRHA